MNFRFAAIAKTIDAPAETAKPAGKQSQNVSSSDFARLPFLNQAPSIIYFDNREPWVSMHDLITSYLRHRGRRIHTGFYEHSWQNLIWPYFSYWDVRSVTEDDFSGWLIWLKQQKVRGPKTRRLAEILFNSFEHAVLKARIESNPTWKEMERRGWLTEPMRIQGSDEVDVDIGSIEI